MGTPGRLIRIPDELWDAAHAAAADDGTTVSDVVREALRRYVRQHQRRRKDDNEQ